jgi:hypothetical protein
MTSFRKFDHLERLGHSEVQGILDGRVWVLPKLDGSNACAWLGDDGTVRAGSRNRELGEGADNHGFRAWLLGSPEAETVRTFVRENPGVILYGEWLVPHSTRGYQDGAWRKLYVFDAFDVGAGGYWPHSCVEDRCGSAGVLVVPHQALLNRPSPELVAEELERCSFLMREGQLGEGVVVKRDGWRNRFGRQTWAKLVREEHGKRREEAAERSKLPVEELIAEDAVTDALVAKELSKGVSQIAAQTLEPEDLATVDPRALFEANKRRLIPETLGRVWHCVVTEELWEQLKRRRDPTVDFRKLKRAVEDRARAALLRG